MLRLIKCCYLFTKPQNIAHVTGAGDKGDKGDKVTLNNLNVLLEGEKTWFNPFSNKPWFLRVCSTSLLKTLWEKEKLLVKSNFSFSLCVF